MTDTNTTQWFWAFLEADLSKAITPESPWLPQIIANLIDDYRHIGPAILHDAERDSALKATLERAEAISAAAPLRWKDYMGSANAWTRDAATLEMDAHYTERREEKPPFPF